MKSRLKKWIVMVLAFALCVGTFSVASAQETTKKDGLAKIFEDLSINNPNQRISIKDVKPKITEEQAKNIAKDAFQKQLKMKVEDNQLSAVLSVRRKNDVFDGRNAGEIGLVYSVTYSDLIMYVDALDGSVSGGARVNGEADLFTFKRFVGSDRYKTSENIYKYGLENASAVYLANGGGFADALIGALLASRDNSPLLLVNPVNNDSLAKLLDNSKAIIVGGQNSISDDSVKGIYTPERIAGKDRFETSVNIAQRLDDFKKLYIVSGENYPDAISIIPLAAKEKAAVLLVKKDAVPESVEDYLKNLNRDVVVEFVGGNSTISSEVKNKIARLLGKYIDVDKASIMGKDRFETNKKIIERYGKSDNLVVASGNNFADSLSISPFANKVNAPILLTNNNGKDGLGLMLLKNNYNSIFIVGGDDSVNRQQLTEQVADIFNATTGIKVLDFSTKAELTWDGFVTKYLSKDFDVYFRNNDDKTLLTDYQVKNLKDVLVKFKAINNSGAGYKTLLGNSIVAVDRASKKVVTVLAFNGVDSSDVFITSDFTSNISMNQFSKDDIKAVIEAMK